MFAVGYSKAIVRSIGIKSISRGEERLSGCTRGLSSCGLVVYYTTIVSFVLEGTDYEGMVQQATRESEDGNPKLNAAIPIWTAFSP